MPGSNARPLPERDLDHVLEHTRDLWEEVRGGRLFVTGGTGFFGRWMLESFLRANQELGLGAQAVVLTRGPGAFGVRAPHVVEHPAIRLHRGDVRSFEFPSFDFTHILHMATETALQGSPGASFQTAVEGTARVLRFAAVSKARKLLLTSSGAVYGPQPPDLKHISEDYLGAPRPEDASAGYAHGKRAAEYLGASAAAEGEFEVKIARCFAFVGPMLPLDANFAIGNFVRDALAGNPIQVAGDGTARRSYLYAADLAVWLWTILFRGASGRPYNVGSESDLSIADLAALVAELVRPVISVQVAGKPGINALPKRYVPSTARAASQLDLHVYVGLDEAIKRMAEWYSIEPTPRPEA
jgi:nucleoside-diphosphate-sugar epimerase